MPVRHPTDGAPVRVHDVLLVARASVARALKDQTLAIVTEVSLCVLAAVGELADVAEVTLTGLGRDHLWNTGGLGAEPGTEEDGR